MIDFNKIRKKFSGLKYNFKIPYPKNSITKPKYMVKVASGLNACWFSGSHKTNKKDALQEIKTKYKNNKIHEHDNIYIIELYKIHNTGTKDILNNIWYQWKKIDNLNITI